MLLFFLVSLTILLSKIWVWNVYCIIPTSTSPWTLNNKVFSHPSVNINHHPLSKILQPHHLSIHLSIYWLISSSSHSSSHSAIQPTLPVAFHHQNDESNGRTDGDDKEDTADVSNADAVALIFDVWTVQLVPQPPSALHVLQLPLVDELQDAVYMNNIL